jgi:hypothetical protein
MTTQGVIILDKIDHVSPTLSDILEEVGGGDSYCWSILFIDGMLHPGQNYSIFDFEDEINKSKDGMHITWDQLILFSDVFFQIYETKVIGSRDPKWLRRRYGGEGNVYETCDFILELVDCALWEVYSKDHDFIERLRKKFKKTEPLELPRRE